MIEDARLDSREVGVLKELTLLQAALPKPLKLRAHHSAAFPHILPHSVSHSRDSGPLGLAVRAGLVAREVAPEERVAARHACRWCQWWNPRTGRGRRILGVTSVSCPASNPKLWKFQALRVDTRHHRTYDPSITLTRAAWPGY